MTLEIALLHEGCPDIEKAVRGPLSAFNEQLFGPAGSQALQIAIRDESGAVLGGLVGRTWYGFLYTQLLFVPEEARGQGLGPRLLAMAEDEARQRGCKGAYIDTLNIAARKVYEKCGYKAVGHMPGMGPGGMTWLAKAL